MLVELVELIVVVVSSVTIDFSLVVVVEIVVVGFVVVAVSPPFLNGVPIVVNVVLIVVVLNGNKSGVVEFASTV